MEGSDVTSIKGGVWGRALGRCVGRRVAFRCECSKRTMMKMDWYISAKSPSSW